MSSCYFSKALRIFFLISLTFQATALAAESASRREPASSFANNVRGENITEETLAALAGSDIDGVGDALSLKDQKELGEIVKNVRRLNDILEPIILRIENFSLEKFKADTIEWFREKKEKILSFRFAWPDLFRRKKPQDQRPAGGVDFARMRLSGVFITEGVSRAIIGENLVEVGDTVNGATVREITGTHVVLETADQEIILRMK